VTPPRYAGRSTLSRTISGNVRPAAAWALRRTKRKTLCELLEITSETRLSHRTTDGTNPLAKVLELVAHPDVDGSAIVVAVLEVFEQRFLNEDPVKLHERLSYLLSKEHDREAAQNRALQMGGPKVNDAIRDHVAALIEIAALRSVLGLERDE